MVYSYLTAFFYSNTLVQSHGTEGREKTDGSPFIGPSSDIYEYIIFRGSDIKELQMTQPPPKPSSFVDPAILDSSVCSYLLSYFYDVYTYI